MEGNKDEALRCVEIARESLAEGNRDKASRFLLKAEKLYSTTEAKSKFSFHSLHYCVFNCPLPQT